MTVDERKMTIAYADLLNIRDLVQHIMLMNADELFNPAAKKAFAQIAIQLDMVMACAAQYVALHTDFNENKEKHEDDLQNAKKKGSEDDDD